ncbi:hypothetical protein [Clostridium butyricum]|uniref:hypothetical protein n=1 Tax=Clostridium butyricum TaxID=1492 RepID=UPI0021056207|nr:hypothetical protein [Clostridium butyricum]MCQ2012336.1 hypothetical protein [Clostridium butyricum]MCQ2024703.1 hypothetical protein [Clostridium butyricum]
MKNNEEILINEQQRKELMDKVDVLDKVGNLLLGNSGFGTAQQVTDYYEVGMEAINSIVKRHREELIENGYRNFKRSEIADVFESSDWTFKSMRGKTIVSSENDEISVTNTGINLFPKRAILNVGMLLTGSGVARELRSRLLDIVHDAEEVIAEW